MKAFLAASLTFCAFVVCASSVSAVVPTPAQAQDSSDAMPFYIPIGTPVKLEQAKKLAVVADDEMKKHNWKMACAIVEPSGDLVYFQKVDGTQYASINISQGKARTAATLRRSTKVFQDQVNNGSPNVMTFPGMVAAEGGVPLVEDGKLIGAIGCSGGSSAQDGVVAQAVAASVK